jgi:hypothetical protein
MWCFHAPAEVRRDREDTAEHNVPIVGRGRAQFERRDPRAEEKTIGLQNEPDSRDRPGTSAHRSARGGQPDITLP